MERLAMLVDETIEMLGDVSVGGRGLYVTLDLMACQKGGDDIASGKPKLMGKEPTPESLAAHLGQTVTETKRQLQELVKADAVTLKPLRVKHFVEDNSEFLAQRKAGKERQRKRKEERLAKIAGKVPKEVAKKVATEVVGKDKTSLDRTGKDKTGTTEVTPAAKRVIARSGIKAQ